MDLNTCPYCKKEFKRESSLASHMCEKKRRHFARDEPSSRLALAAFQKFWSMHHSAKTPKTFEDFADSSYYLGFKRWGNYCVDVRAINPEAYLKHLLKTNTGLDRWCRDSVYSEYLLNYLTIEPVCDALARSVEYSLDWADETRMAAHDVLRYGNVNKLMLAVSAGRLSPWAIYCSNSGREWLSSLRDDQLQIVWTYVNAGQWDEIMNRRPEDTAYANEILSKAGW